MSRGRPVLVERWRATLTVYIVVMPRAQGSLPIVCCGVPSVHTRSVQGQGFTRANERVTHLRCRRSSLYHHIYASSTLPRSHNQRTRMLRSVSIRISSVCADENGYGSSSEGIRATQFLATSKRRVNALARITLSGVYIPCTIYHVPSRSLP